MTTRTPRAAEIRTALALVAGAYPTITVTEATIATWDTILGDLPAGSILAGCRGLLATRSGPDGRWPPSPGDVRDAALGGLVGFDGEPAILAWGRVLAEVARLREPTPWMDARGWPTITTERRVALDLERRVASDPEHADLDAATWDALRAVCGSWAELRDSDGAGRASVRARFLEAYEALRARRRLDRLLPAGVRRELEDGARGLRLLAGGEI